MLALEPPRQKFREFLTGWFQSTGIFNAGYNDRCRWVGLRKPVLFLWTASIRVRDILAQIGTVTPQRDVGELEGLEWEKGWREEYEWIAGLAPKKKSELSYSDFLYYIWY
jgi:hypothetical protein